MGRREKSASGKIKEIQEEKRRTLISKRNLQVVGWIALISAVMIVCHEIRLIQREQDPDQYVSASTEISKAPAESDAESDGGPSKAQDADAEKKRSHSSAEQDAAAEERSYEEEIQAELMALRTLLPQGMYWNRMDASEDADLYEEEYDRAYDEEWVGVSNGREAKPEALGFTEPAGGPWGEPEDEEDFDAAGPWGEPEDEEDFDAAGLWGTDLLHVTDIPCAHGYYDDQYCHFYDGTTKRLFPQYESLTQCLAFASFISDRLFGREAPVRLLEDFDQLRPGDHIRTEYGVHSMIVIEKEGDLVRVLEVDEDTEHCEISWDREVSRWALEEFLTQDSAMGEEDLMYITRYQED